MGGVPFPQSFSFATLQRPHGPGPISCSTAQSRGQLKASLIGWYLGPALADISWSQKRVVLGLQGVFRLLRHFLTCNVKRGFPYICEGHPIAHEHMQYISNGPLLW
jgi:hypothetical protein